MTAHELIILSKIQNSYIQKVHTNITLQTDCSCVRDYVKTDNIIRIHDKIPLFFNNF